jgi:hypothetical protein
VHTSLPKKPGAANLLERLSPAAREHLSRQGVELEQALGLIGTAGRPTSSPRERDAPPAGELTPQSRPAGNRRDRRAHAKLDAAAVTAERAKRRARRDVRAERRFAAKMAKWGAEEPDGGWRGIPREVWVMAWDCVGDGTGGVLRYWMRRCRNKTFLGAARAAALAGGARTWQDLRARRIVACALVQDALSVTVARPGRWTELVRGVPVGAFAALLVPPGSEARPLHRNTLTGQHRGVQSDSARGQDGYLRALEESGALYSQQLPADEVDPFERCGPSGHACNRYWLLSPIPTVVDDQAEREQLIALHRAGQAAATEVLTARPTALALRRENAARDRQLRAAVFGPEHAPP